MELNREHFRAIIFYIFQSGLTQQQCINELNSIFDYKAPSRTSVYRWYSEFNRGRSLLQDEFCEGCPKSVVSPEFHWCCAPTGIARSSCDLSWDCGNIRHKWDQHTFNIAWTFDCQKNLFALDSTQFVNRSKKSINQSGKSDSTIGSNACKNVLTLMGNILKNNKAIFDD